MRKRISFGIACVLVACGPSTHHEPIEPAATTHAVLAAPAMIDLGVLPGMISSEAHGVSDSGIVFGVSRAADWATRAFVWTERDGMTDVGTLGGSWTVGAAISNSGHLVGTSEVPGGRRHAFLWSRRGMTDLGLLPGLPDSNAVGVNSRGWVTGFGHDRYERRRAFVWTPAGGMQDLGSLGGTSTEPSAMSESGDIVGVGTTQAGAVHAFVWSDGHMVDLGVPPGFEGSAALAVSGSGRYVAGYLLAPDGTRHAFVWSRQGGFANLGALLGDVRSTAVAVNDSGHVVVSTYPGGSGRAFIWSERDGVTNLGTLAPYFTIPADLTNSGLVVGNASTELMRHAFLWSRVDGILDLGTLGGPSSWAYAVSEGGLVVGTSGTADGEAHAVVWTSRRR